MQEPVIHHSYHRLTRKQEPPSSENDNRRSLSIKEISPTRNQNLETVPLSGVYDKNGKPLNGVYMQIPKDDKQALDASQLKASVPITSIRQKPADPTPPSLESSTQDATPSLDDGESVSAFKRHLEEIKNLPPDDPKRKLFLDSLNDSLGGALPGIGVGVAAAGAGMAAGEARKQEFYFQKTKYEYRLNLEAFRIEYNDSEYTLLRECNLYASTCNGKVESMLNNFTYIINNRILEMIDLA